MAAPKPSRFPADGSALDTLDKTISGPIFRLQLGLVLEALLSVPGCYFGMPAAHVIAPTLVACSIDPGACRAATPATQAAAAIFGLALLVWWASAQYARNSKALRHLYLAPALIVSPIVGMLVVHAVAAGSASAMAAAHFYLVVWNLSLIPILTIKHAAGRRRPVACDAADIGEATTQAAERKALSNICAMLKAGDANAAFPSGDVAGSVAFAYPLWHCAVAATAPEGLRVAALCCIGLSALGRMYWQAHHALDVTVGGLVSLLTCYLADVALGAFGEGGTATMPWWHAFAAQGALIVFAKASGTASAAPVGKKTGR